MMVHPSLASLYPSPIVKWAGGKTQLLRELERHLPPAWNRYFEPFVGGGALFFRLSPSLVPGQVFLNDFNEELINLYQVVREQVEQLIEHLAEHKRRYAKQPEAYYYHVRSLSVSSLSSVERAARLLFLNKTCYNGLYRVNRAGQFNVPFGRYKNPPILDPEGLRAASAALRKAELRHGDFEAAVAGADTHDLIYFDPPYHPVSTTANFTSYTSQSFGEEEQRRLARLFRRLDEKGCYLILSNSDTPLIHELYAGYAIRIVQANRAINSNARRRKGATEVIVCNFDR